MANVEGKVKIRHIGHPVSPACGCVAFTDTTMNPYLGLARYKQLGVRERFKGEAPYRICKRCMAVIKKQEERL